MDVWKADSSLKRRKFYASSSEKNNNCLPAITKNYPCASRIKIQTFHQPACGKNAANAARTPRLHQFKVKREVHCKSFQSPTNMYRSNTMEQDSSFLNTQITNTSHSKSLVKLPRIKHGDCGRPLGPPKFHKGVDLKISDKQPGFYKNNCLKISAIQLLPKSLKKPENNTVITARVPPIQPIFPTLQLSPTEKNVMVAVSSALSMSVESLDSIIGGPLTLTQPPPDLLSSCSPSEFEFSASSTP